MRLRRRPRTFIKYLVILAFTISNVSLAAPLTFNTALPVAEDEFVFRQQLRWVNADSTGAGLNSDLSSRTSISVLGYGATPNLALFTALPLRKTTLHQESPGQNLTRTNQGLGDMTSFARYTFWKQDAPGRTTRLAGFAGLTIPTGSDNDFDSLGRLPPMLQNGSGTWHRFGGFVATWQNLANQFDGQISYRDNRESNGFEAGDETRIDLSWQHRLYPRELASGLPGFLYGVLEINWLQQERNSLNGQVDPGSGGQTLWISPGVQYVTRRWILEIGIQKPMSQSLRGASLENDYIGSIGFRVNF